MDLIGSEGPIALCRKTHRGCAGEQFAGVILWESTQGTAESQTGFLTGVTGVPCIRTLNHVLG